MIATNEGYLLRLGPACKLQCFRLKGALGTTFVCVSACQGAFGRLFEHRLSRVYMCTPLDMHPVLPPWNLMSIHRDAVGTIPSPRAWKSNLSD